MENASLVIFLTISVIKVALGVEDADKNQIFVFLLLKAAHATDRFSQNSFTREKDIMKTSYRYIIIFIRKIVETV